MVAGFIIGGLVLAVLSVLALLVLGFIANTERFEGRMKSPGCYWTWSMAIGVTLGAVTDASLTALLYGVSVMFLASIVWVVDMNRKKEDA